LNREDNMKKRGKKAHAFNSMRINEREESVDLKNNFLKKIKTHLANRT